MDFENIFKKSIPDYKKLVKYGFKKEGFCYKYSVKIIDDLEAIITVCNDKVDSKIIDTAFGEEYTNHKISNQTGEFVGKVREEYTKILNNIKDKCFIDKPFITNQANRISKLIFTKYKSLPIFKWDNLDAAVFENNNKWFGLIMNVDRSKFSDLEGETEIINIKLDNHKITNLLKEKGFYKAYHMNKKNWITITLDDTINDEKLMKLIEESYSYTVSFKGAPNQWVMPINPSYFDIFTYFDSTDLYYWDKRKNFKKGDLVYLYVTKPIGSIMYKCIIDSFTDEFMIVKRLCKYEKDKYKLETLKKYGLTSVRSTRHIPVNLSKYLEETDAE